MNDIKVASRDPVALSIRTTVEVLTQAFAPVHDRMAGDACSEAALIVEMARVLVETGFIINLVYIVVIEG